MATWQLGLLLLGAVWALQSVGVWLQMRHYREALGDIEARFADGFVGTGYTRGHLTKGTIALLVVSQNLEVRRVAIMSGWSVFAKFKPLREFEGKHLDDLRRSLDHLARLDKGLAGALTRAIAQADTVRQSKAQMSSDAGTGTALTFAGA